METLSWARQCNKLHPTICIVLLSEFVSQNAWLQQYVWQLIILTTFNISTVKTDSLPCCIPFVYFLYSPWGFLFLKFLIKNFTIMMGLIYMPFNIRWVRKMTSLICLHQIFFFLVQFLGFKFCGFIVINTQITQSMRHIEKQSLSS